MSKTNPLPHLGFRKTTPCTTLAEFIGDYWFITASNNKASNYNELLHPDGGMGIILNYGGAISFDNKNIGEESFLDGTNSTTTRLGLMGPINAIGIRFKTAGAYPFFNMPLNELRNKNVLCSDMNLHGIPAFYDTLAKLETDKGKTHAIDEFMLKLRQTDRIVSKAVRQSIVIIKAHYGRLSIKRLSNHIGITQRTLERSFKSQMGMSPSEYAKVIRIEQARLYLKQFNLSYNDIAYKLDFYDQAHFINQFKSVVGFTPSEYRQRVKHNRTRSNPIS